MIRALHIAPLSNSIRIAMKSAGWSLCVSGLSLITVAATSLADHVDVVASLLGAICVGAGTVILLWARWVTNMVNENREEIVSLKAKVDGFTEVREALKTHILNMHDFQGWVYRNTTRALPFAEEPPQLRAPNMRDSGEHKAQER